MCHSIFANKHRQYKLQSDHCMVHVNRHYGQLGPTLLSLLPFYSESTIMSFFLTSSKELDRKSYIKLLIYFFHDTEVIILFKIWTLESMCGKPAN